MFGFQIKIHEKAHLHGNYGNSLRARGFLKAAISGSNQEDLQHTDPESYSLVEII
jgi:hypothetical protein